MSIRCAVVAAFAGAVSATAAHAVVVPFTETFDGPAANWSSAAAFTPLNYPASGGPDGSAFGSTSVNFANAQPGDQPIIFRAQSNFSSSNNNFVGDWITAGVTDLSLQVRHNGPAAVGYFVRFAPAAGPGAVFLFTDAVPANQWTTLSVPINSSTPFIFEGTTFPGTFSNVARVQIGILVGGLAGNPNPVTFDIDNAAIIPAPGAATLLSLALLAAGRRRR